MSQKRKPRVARPGRSEAEPYEPNDEPSSMGAIVPFEEGDELAGPLCHECGEETEDGLCRNGDCVRNQPDEDLRIER